MTSLPQCPEYLIIAELLNEYTKLTIMEVHNTLKSESDIFEVGDVLVSTQSMGNLIQLIIRKKSKKNKEVYFKLSKDSYWSTSKTQDNDLCIIFESKDDKPMYIFFRRPKEQVYTYNKVEKYACPVFDPYNDEQFIEVYQQTASYTLTISSFLSQGYLYMGISGYLLSEILFRCGIKYNERTATYAEDTIMIVKLHQTIKTITTAVYAAGGCSDIDFRKYDTDCGNYTCVIYGKDGYIDVSSGERYEIKKDVVMKNVIYHLDRK